MRHVKDNISVKVIVKHTSDSHRDHFVFTDKWNFRIDKYIFSKISNTELEVSFSFEARLTRIDEDRHITHQELPSEYTKKFQVEEELLEALLDIISLSTRTGLQIKPESYQFSSSTSRDEPNVNNLNIDPPDITSNEKRYQWLIKYRSKRKGLISALRAYRLGLWSEQPGYRIPLLYSSLEQAYGKGYESKLLTKDERKKIVRCLDSISLDKAKIDKVLYKLSEIPAKTLNETLVEKISLMNENGQIDANEKKKLFVLWAKARSIAAHGNILPPRGLGIQTLLHELQSTTEALLYGEVKPKLIHYFLFKESALKSQFVKNKGRLISKLGDYCCFAARNDMLMIYLKNIGGEIIIENEYVYWISPNGVNRISNNNIVESIDISTLDVLLQRLVSKIMKKFST